MRVRQISSPASTDRDHSSSPAASRDAHCRG
jgi:hypothetical protein